VTIALNRRRWSSGPGVSEAPEAAGLPSRCFRRLLCRATRVGRAWVCMPTRLVEGSRVSLNARDRVPLTGTSGTGARTAATVAPVSSRVPSGVVHKLPGDLQQALVANPTALDAWKTITPLARNEFICWVEDAKQKSTRARRIRRTQEELEEGQRRPCCWPGCKHRERTGR
jgi:hypothetical protein